MFFGSLVSLATNVVGIAVAPIVLVVEVADAALKPVAEVVKDLAQDIKDAVS